LALKKTKSPRFNKKKYNIIENYVVSWKKLISFYKIVKTKFYDYNIEIEDGENENGVNNYDEEYKKSNYENIKTKKI
jgi:hypothetical protein